MDRPTEAAWLKEEALSQSSNPGLSVHLWGGFRNHLSPLKPVSQISVKTKPDRMISGHLAEVHPSKNSGWNWDREKEGLIC
jgi:hypothetical protein